MISRIGFHRIATAVLTSLLTVPLGAWAGGFGVGQDLPQTFAVSDDVGVNQITFTSSAPLEEIHGTASGVSGSVRFNPQAPDSLSGSISVDVRSMRTGISKRDGHLMSDDWLDADQFPTITFGLKRLDGISSTGGTGTQAPLKGSAVGDFTLHGVTKSIVIPIEATFLVESPATRKRASGDLLLIKASFQIALADFDVSGARGIVGKRVGKTIEVKAQFFAYASDTE